MSLPILDSLRARIHSRVSLPLLLLMAGGIGLLIVVMSTGIRQIATSANEASARLAIATAASDLGIELERVVQRLKTVEGVNGRSPSAVVDEEIGRLDQGLQRLRQLPAAEAFAPDVALLGDALNATRVAARDAVVARWALIDLATIAPTGIVEIRSEARDLTRILSERRDPAVNASWASLVDDVDRLAVLSLDFFAAGTSEMLETIRFGVSALADRIDRDRPLLGPLAAAERQALNEFERARSRLYRFVTEQGGASDRARSAANGLAAQVDQVGGIVRGMRNEAASVSERSVASIDHASRWIDQTIVGSGLCAVCVALAILVWLDTSIIGPLDRLNESMKRLARGDRHIEISGVTRRDEVGDMARSLSIFRDRTVEQQRLEQEAAEQARQQAARRAALDEAVLAFRRQVSSIVAGVRDGGAMTRQVATTLGGALSISQESMERSRAAAQETSSNITMVASAADELAASIRQIGDQTVAAMGITQSAREVGSRSTAKVNELVRATARIDDIIRLIRTIAGQINLLSLNAAIEAARAGEAGRGFAVVASEVKALAQATDAATLEITGQVNLIQQATHEAAETMSTIEGVLAQVGAFSEAVAQSVDQQGQATMVIASTTAQAASRAEALHAGFQSVETTFGEVHEAVVEVMRLSQDFADTAEALADGVDRFLDVAAA